MPRELIDRALAIGAQAPTACNRMPYEFRVFDDTEIVSGKGSRSAAVSARRVTTPIRSRLLAVGGSASWRGLFHDPRDRPCVLRRSRAFAAMSFIFALLETQGTVEQRDKLARFRGRSKQRCKSCSGSISARAAWVMLIAFGLCRSSDTFCFFAQKKGLRYVSQL